MTATTARGRSRHADWRVQNLQNLNSPKEICGHDGNDRTRSKKRWQEWSTRPWRGWLHAPCIEAL
jgi:hypothetical protein